MDMVNEVDNVGIEFLHSKQLLSGLNQLRQRRELCDVELCVGNVQVLAHRVVLSACSAYFDAMFTGNLSESQKQVIHIKEIDEVALKILVDFAYTGIAEVTHHNVQVLLPAANMLQLTKVKESCCRFLAKQLHSSNCLGITKFAEAYSCPTLVKKAKKFTQDRFCDVIQQEEFLHLPCSQLVELLQDDNLNVESEKAVLEAVVSWVKYQKIERGPLLIHLLQNVRLSLLTLRTLTHCLESNELIRADRRCLTLINDQLKYRLGSCKRRSFNSVIERARRSPTRIFAVGGKNGLFATLNSVEVFEPLKFRWNEIAPMKMRRFEFGAAVLQGKVHIYWHSIVIKIPLFWLIGCHP